MATSAPTRPFFIASASLGWPEPAAIETAVAELAAAECL
jgi:hypothetical protein